MICTYQQWGYSITTLKFWSISKPTSNVISVWNFDLRIFLVYGLGAQVFSVSTSNWWIIVLHLPNSPSLTFYLSLWIAGRCIGFRLQFGIPPVCLCPFFWTSYRLCPCFSSFSLIFATSKMVWCCIARLFTYPSWRLLLDSLVIYIWSICSHVPMFGETQPK